jgi:alpha-galactosidase
MKIISLLFLMLLTGTFSLPANAQASDSTYILTPPPGPAPRINGAQVFGVRPDHPILFRIPATGIRPMKFSAKNLPRGVKVDKKTGEITGSIAKPGDYVVTLEARNKKGKATRNFTIKVGETIGLTPPMGWNSWNIYGTKVTQALVLANAKAMAGSGLINHGWAYMNIDDAWQGSRGGKWNAIQPNPETFPDIQHLSGELHQLGLKLGIYSTPWVESYGHHVGGSANNPAGNFERTKKKVPRNRKLFPYAIGKYTFVDQDVRQWATWGIDYLKYDWNPIELPETKKMYNALRASGRDIFLSLSNSTPYHSIDSLSKYANSWRTGGDIRDNWESLKKRLFSQDKWARFAGPGHWNDPDMLVVGYVGWGHGEHPTKLTADEQYTHISAWCLMSVPLLLGCDLTKLDPFTLNLLTNDEVLALDQDPLGRQATVIARQGETGIMAKDLADGSKAAGLFNTGDDGPTEMILKWSDLGISGPYIVRDLWRQKDLGTFNGEFKATVPQHGVVLVGLRKVK